MAVLTERHFSRNFFIARGMMFVKKRRFWSLFFLKLLVNAASIKVQIWEDSYSLCVVLGGWVSV